MAGLSLFNHFLYKPISMMPQFSSKTSLFPANLIGFTTIKSRQRLKVSIREHKKARPVFRVKVVNEEDESTPEEEAEMAVAEEEGEDEEEEEEEELDKLKKQLVSSLYDTDRGLRATREKRGEIVELFMELEVKNPTPAPTQALTLLNGKWILVYISFVGLSSLLSSGALPPVKVEEISQTFDTENFRVQNSVLIAGPYATTSIITNAKFEIQNPKRVQIKFEEGIIGTPQLTDSVVLPENLEFIGQKIDLAPFKGLITTVQDTASSVAKTISSQPPLKFSISNSNAESWLLITYLDNDLRISRGDAGSVFVLVKEGSQLLTP
ncbi:plastid-lipid-associated protein, chloroplastic-like [Cornus florida]|uniref:plastid-lipid-associated protein, chloroplastic-like n=1 Tax=Cornus florida TaxID=4283 RepID=UPI0028A28F68|nr:plastid-lipid-associated protein, chloroplastic-like [Cornus florida]